MKTFCRAISAIAFTAILTACGQGGGASPLSTVNTGTADATRAVPVSRQPGSWTFVHATMAFDAENVAGGMAELVKAGKASIGKKDTGDPLCLSAEIAGKDELMVRLNEAMRFGNEWKITKSEVKDGRVDFAAAMEDPVQGKSEMTISGTITETATDLVVTTDAWQPAPGKGHIHTVMKQVNKRVGDCLPGQEPWQ